MDWKIKPSKYISTLEKKCETAQLARNIGKKTSPLAKNIMGKKIDLVKNGHRFSWVKALDEGTHYVLEIGKEDGSITKIPFDYKEWRYHESEDFPPYSIMPIDRFKGLKRNFVVAGNYAWVNPRTLAFSAYYVNWVSERKFAIEQKADGTIYVNVKDNYNTSPGEMIKGTLEK